MVLFTITLVAIVALFVSVVSFMVLEAPPFIRTMLGVKIDGPSPVRGEVVELGAERVALRIEPHADESVAVFASIFENGGYEPSQVVGPFPGTRESTEFLGLKQATRYRVRLWAEGRYAESEPTDIEFSTNATAIGIFIPGGSINGNRPGGTFTGKTNLTSEPHDPNGVVMVSDHIGIWRYEGPVVNGRMHGQGKIVLFESSEEFGGCVGLSTPWGEVCGSRCDSIEFDEGRLVSGSCEMLLGDYAYTGQIGPGGVSFDTIIAGQQFLPNGPGVAYSSTSYEYGTFENGTLEGAGERRMRDGSVLEGHFTDGKLIAGHIYDDVAGVSFTRNAGFDHGASILLSPWQFRFGRMAGYPNNIWGYGGGTAQNGGLSQTGYFWLSPIERGSSPRDRAPTSTNATDLPNCYNSENFGTDWAVEGVNVHADNRGGREMRIEVDSLGLSATVTKRSGAMPEFDMTFLDGLSVMDNFEIDGFPVKIDRAADFHYNERHDVRAPLLLTRLCRAESIKNLDTGRVLEPMPFCPALALFLARAYFCGP